MISQSRRSFQRHLFSGGGDDVGDLINKPHDDVGDYMKTIKDISFLMLPLGAFLLVAGVKWCQLRKRTQNLHGGLEPWTWVALLIMVTVAFVMANGSAIQATQARQLNFLDRLASQVSLSSLFAGAVVAAGMLGIFWAFSPRRRGHRRRHR